MIREPVSCPRCGTEFIPTPPVSDFLIGERIHYESGAGLVMATVIRRAPKRVSIRLDTSARPRSVSTRFIHKIAALEPKP